MSKNSEIRLHEEEPDPDDDRPSFRKWLRSLTWRDYLVFVIASEVFAIPFWIWFCRVLVRWFWEG